jgi:hypothetical protein
MMVCATEREGNARQARKRASSGRRTRGQRVRSREAASWIISEKRTSRLGELVMNREWDVLRMELLVPSDAEKADSEREPDREASDARSEGEDWFAIIKYEGKN